MGYYGFMVLYFLAGAIVLDGTKWGRARWVGKPKKTWWALIVFLTGWLLWDGWHWLTA